MKSYSCPACRCVLPSKSDVPEGICPRCSREYEYDSFGPVIRKLGRIYIANSIPRAVRIKHVLSAIFLILSGTIGLLLGGVFVPVSGMKGIVVHGFLAWAAAIGMLAAAAVLASVVLDHYDKRDNERSYRKFAYYAEALAWSLWASVILTNMLLGIM